VGHSGPIKHDPSKPDGTLRKLVDVSRMTALGWRANTPLQEGIAQTYAWYQDHEDELVAV
jgi:nucleoside-diphosphate-sugar epimerase